jgi:hypothetical protein
MADALTEPDVTTTSGTAEPEAPLAVQTWEGRGVSLGEVISALPDLRHQASGRGAATRTAVMTIVMVVGADDDPEVIAAPVRALGAHHPCRAVVLRPDPDSTPVVNAKAFLWRAEPTVSEGHPVFFEELHLHVGGQAASHLASIVGPFVLADLPVVMWFPDVLPDPADPLLRLANALVVDTRLVLPDHGAMGHSYRTLVQCICSASVTGKPGPRHILGGWLMSQLDLRARELVLTDSKHVGITLEAICQGEEGTFQVKRDDDARAVWAKATLSNGMSHSQALPLPDDSLTSALSSAISNLRADRVWERALAAAAALAS